MTTNEPTKPRVPFELIPTSLPGVFISPAPPADFDPNTVSPEELIKYGIWWPRPGEKGDPALRATWESSFSRWHEMTRIIPEFGPPIVRRHILREVTQVGPGLWEGPSWAGSVEFGNWNGVVGRWTIPTVTKPGVPQGLDWGGWHSSSWIGLDGTDDTSNEVLQAGVQQMVDADGNATYVPWFEWWVPPDLPNGSYSEAFDPYPYVNATPITNFPVEPGQNIGCIIFYSSIFSTEDYTTGYITLINNDTNEYVSTMTLKAPPGATLRGKTAEWIMEAPGGGTPATSLPAFTPVVFTMARCSRGKPSVPGFVSGSPSDPPPVGNTYNIKGLFGITLTSVTTGPDTGSDIAGSGQCTINYIGP